MTSQSQQIGALLVEKNLITEEQLAQALVRQQESGERLGEILVAEFGVPRLQIAEMLAAQWADLEKENKPALEVVEPLTPTEVHLRRPLGEILIESGLISRNQLEAALDLQRTTGNRIGEILVEQGVLTRLDLATALSEHASSPVHPDVHVGAVGMPLSQNGSPVTPTPVQGWSDDDRAVVADLEERLSMVERAAGGTPWQEDLRLLAFDLRAKIGAVEQSVDAGATGAVSTNLVAALETVSSRLDALENAPVTTEVGALRQELEELKARPVTVTGIEELRAAVERLEGLQGPEMPDRTEQIAQLTTELGVLAARLDEIPGTGELRDRLEAVAEQAEVAQAGIAGLSRRVDELAGLEGRLDQLAASVPSDHVIEELQRALAGLAVSEANDGGSGHGAQIASLAARLEQLAARVDDVAAAPVADFSPRLDDLSERVEEVAAAIPSVEAGAITARIELLEEGSLAGHGTLERLAAEIEELRVRMEGELGALATGTADPLPVAELRGELAGLAERLEAGLERRPDGDALAAVAAELRAELAVLAERLEVRSERGPDAEALTSMGVELRGELAMLAERLEWLERRPDGDAVAGVAAELRGELAGLSERLEAGLERRPDGDAVAGVAAGLRAELQAELGALAGRLEAGLERRPDGDAVAGVAAELRGELAMLAERLEWLERRPDGEALAGVAAELRGELAGLAERLEAGLERRPDGDALAGVAAELRAELQAELGALAGRLEAGLERRPDGGALAGVAAELRGELAGLAERLEAGLERRPDGDALAGVAAELRVELARLAERSVSADSGELLELSQRIDRSARDGHERIDGLAEELSLRISGATEELGRRVDEIAGRADGLVSRDEAAEQAALVRMELEELREWTSVRAAAVDGVLAEADITRVLGQQELENRVDEAVRTIRADLETQGERLGATANETATLGARIDELREAAAGHDAFEARLESMLEERLGRLASRLTHEVAGARAEAERALDAVRGETGSLGARIDELQGLRRADVQTARVASERLADRIEAVAGLRAGDLEAAELAGAELAARLEDQAMRSAAAVHELGQLLRTELGGIAAQVEERDASGIEARDQLRSELERIASSMGWRLERIEQSLAAKDTAELKASVEELGRRFDEQVAVGQEQVRVTERALRKGLASLGERLVETESTYHDAGNALRRSIERLGAAVVEADARMADQIPVSEAEGCVAFAPTAAGYRLVELPGRPPELGSTIELEIEGCEGALVVTRYGRSPLPLDGRPCAYLDRA